MSDAPVVAKMGPGTFRVEAGGRGELVYVAGTGADRWAFWNGHVFHAGDVHRQPAHRSRGQATGVQPVTAPMPATVVKVLVAPGSTVTKGETLVLLEAMKMELPVRSMVEGRVTAVHCTERQRVQAGQTLVDIDA
jgi:3-methylcrotonyl-CoA carboxylase alpha subunit